MGQVSIDSSKILIKVDTVNFSNGSSSIYYFEKPFENIEEM
jgi:hypothetical protein